jgi:hypothetical protein
MVLEKQRAAGNGRRMRKAWPPLGKAVARWMSA